MDSMRMEKLNARKGKSGLRSSPLRKAAPCPRVKDRCLHISLKTSCCTQIWLLPQALSLQTTALCNTALFQGGAMAVLNEPSLSFRVHLAK